MEFKYKVIREWLERNKDTAFTKAEIKALKELIRRLAE